MPSRAPVAQGANRCLPLPMAFCETSCCPPLSLTSYVSLAVSIYVLAYFLCWFSVGKCQVRFCLRGFWQVGWSTNDGGKNRHTGSECVSARLYLIVSVCAFMFAVIYRYTCVCVWLCLESRIRYQSCQCICFTSKNRGHAMLFYDLPIHVVWRKLMQCAAQRLLLLK